MATKTTLPVPAHALASECKQLKKHLDDLKCSADLVFAFNPPRWDKWALPLGEALKVCGGPACGQLHCRWALLSRETHGPVSGLHGWAFFSHESEDSLKALATVMDKIYRFYGTAVAEVPDRFPERKQWNLSAAGFPYRLFYLMLSYFDCKAHRYFAPRCLATYQYAHEGSNFDDPRYYLTVFMPGCGSPDEDCPPWLWQPHGCFWGECQFSDARIRYASYSDMLVVRQAILNEPRRFKEYERQWAKRWKPEATCRVLHFRDVQQKLGYALDVIWDRLQSRPGSKSRRGRRREYDREADARLVRDWEAARNQGQTKAGFCRERGIDEYELEKALDRNRKRKSREV